jgi:hypothetical protein
MGLSKRHLDTNEDEVRVNLEALGEALKKGVPEIEFAFILGSSAENRHGTNPQRPRYRCVSRLETGHARYSRRF